MAKTVAEQFVEVLAAAGVKRIYGIVGDSLNGLTDAIRRQGKIEWIHVRHEEVAAFAAGAEAHLTGELAVCAGSCGPGPGGAGGPGGRPGAKVEGGGTGACGSVRASGGAPGIGTGVPGTPGGA